VNTVFDVEFPRGFRDPPALIPPLWYEAAEELTVPVGLIKGGGEVDPSNHPAANDSNLPSVFSFLLRSLF
jgi:hypothetical protein